jgi:hypothetical protein
MPTLDVVVISLAPADQQGRYFAVQGLTWFGRPQTIAPAAFTWLLGQDAEWPWTALVTACGLSFVILSRLQRLLPGGSDSSC